MSDLLIAPNTTLKLGGPAGRIVTVTDENQLAETVAELDAKRWPLILLGGGSNVVVADDGFPGVVVLVRGHNIAEVDGAMTVGAGTPWDDLVAFAVDHQLSGIECLSGIPGSTGATPIQNVGAYGQDVSQTIISVKVYDRHQRETREIPCEACGFEYRTSRFKSQPGRYVVIAVTFGLRPSACSQPIAYRELADKLGVPIGETAPLEAVRAAVLELRGSKGMVLNAHDPDTRSVGSFFTNPIVDASLVTGWDETPPSWPQSHGKLKLSAAWLVQQAGFDRGFGSAQARISTKHALALTSGETGTTQDLLALARQIRGGVFVRFGIKLVPEPVLIGVQL